MTVVIEVTGSVPQELLGEFAISDLVIEEQKSSP